MTDALTVAEAVPLGTVYLQRLLAGAGVRSLVIKGPAFVALGVRARRRSNDIDLIVHPGDRRAATETLTRAGWSIISHWFPPALDDVIYSTTFRHPRFPVTLDLHHRFSGLLTDPARAFEALWDKRTTVEVAHRDVITVGCEHALVIEVLNATKLLPVDSRAAATQRVVDAAVEVDLDAVTAAAVGIGARHTAAALIRALGGEEPSECLPAGYHAWMSQGARHTSRDLIFEIVRRAPMDIPRVIWGQLTLDPDTARFWAETHGVAYRSRWQVLRLRIRRALKH